MINKIKKLLNAIRKINTLEKKIMLMNNELRHFIPETLPINKALQDEIDKFEKNYKITKDINYAIAKNDLMFRYACYHIGSMQKALYGYLETGLNPLNIIVKITESVFKEGEVESILDFAAGYGRVTRFLTSYFSPEKVWAAEVKPKAVEFIKEYFKCNTLLSTFEPENFKPNHKFDVIYVGSLFSHLPEPLFKRWLKTLYNLISENGLLILSTHDISLINKTNKNAYVFIEESEDQMFSEVDDFIKDTGVYGASFIGETRIKQIFSEEGIQTENYKLYKRVLSNVQDVYCIAKKPLNMNVDLTTFP